MIEVINLPNADSLWAELSDRHKDSNADNEIIYRGHSNAKWDLVPTILRSPSIQRFEKLFGHYLNSEDQVWAEFVTLQQFIYSCDVAGTAVPNDSVRFREENLTQERIIEYIQYPNRWPSKELMDSMAMAQLHGLPTRLLDWTTNPYVAAYFAASQALRDWSRREEGQELAIFALKQGAHSNTYCGPVRILRVGGSTSDNVVAQQGLFTVHPILEEKGQRVVVKNLEEYLPSDRSMLKLTVPVNECVDLYELCLQFGFNAARLFPTADGASRTVIENQSYILAHAELQSRRES
ncbi:MAG: FRG domain-containing protein [Bacteroidota bacterium]|nr:FRG domain-containing protein [Bacteroidota bacterium]